MRGTTIDIPTTTEFTSDRLTQLVGGHATDIDRDVADMGAVVAELRYAGASVELAETILGRLKLSAIHLHNFANLNVTVRG